MRATHIIIAGLVCASAISARAQDATKTEDLPSTHKVVYFGDGSQTTTEDTNSLINIFYEDQFRHAQDPRAPYFLLMSRDSKIAMGVGGKAQGNLAYDFDGSIDGTNFLPYKIAVPRDAANPTSFQASVAETAVFFTVFGRSKLGNYIVNVEGKFSGASNAFVLKKAYITLGNFTLGKNKSTFSDPSAVPSTVETEGPAGAIDNSTLLLRYMLKCSSKFTIAASIETPDNQYLTSDGITESTSDCAPNVAAFVQYGSSDSHIRLSGLYKNMRYRDLVAQKNHHLSGYGVSLTAVGKILNPLTFYGGVNYGKGIGSTINNLSTGDNDLISYASGSPDYGKMYAPETLAWFAALQYNFTPDIFSTLVFSQDHIYTKAHSDYASDAYRYGMYAAANVFWNITNRLQVGAEFDWGRRVDINGQGSNAHRLCLMGAFSF